MVPTCFTMIVTSRYNYWNLRCSGKIRDNEVSLLMCLHDAIVACGARKYGAAKEGKPFEIFFQNALRARLYVRLLNSTKSSSGSVVTMPLRKLLPGVDDPACRLLVHDDSGQEWFLHTISSKDHLQKLLTIPLYYMFPVGINNTLRKESTCGPTLKSWIEKSTNHSIIQESTMCSSEPPIRIGCEVFPDKVTFRILQKNQKNSFKVGARDFYLAIKNRESKEDLLEWVLPNDLK